MSFRYPQRRCSAARVLCCLLWLCGLAGTLAAQSPPAPAGGTITGVVKSGNTPIPGVTVTASNTLTGQKAATSTDLDGSYSLQLPADGRYVVRVQMPAFAPVTQEVLMNASNRSARADFALVLLSRAQQQNAPGENRAMGNRMQSLSVLANEAGQDYSGNGNGIGSGQIAPPGMPPGFNGSTATESVAVSGNAMPGFGGMSSEEMRQRMQDARDRDPFAGGGGGDRGPRGPGGQGGPGGPGGPMILMGGRGRFDFNKPHGMVYYSAGDAALNAAPYSLTRQPVTKPGYLQQRFGISLGGPLNIPKIYKGGDKTFFFLNYNGARGDNPYDAFSTVPTRLERQGNFSQTRVISGPNAGQLVQLYDPSTHLPITGNTITSINSTAAALLPFIPMPNLPGDVQNFHFTTSLRNNTDDLNIRLIRALGSTTVGPSSRGGPRNNLNFGLHYHRTDSTLGNPFPTVGGNTSVRSWDVPVGWTRTFGKMTNSFRVDYNRNRTSMQNLYAFAENVAGNAGITGISQNPFDFGLPGLSFTNFGAVNDINPVLRRDQTFSVSDNMILNRGKHTLRWGGDFRRIQINTETDSNARGSFTFTGASTAQVVGGLPVQGTGFDFADFLLGLPQQNAVQFGANSYHFRGNSWDLFVQDEWRVRGNLSLNLGLRYEYVSPLTELNDRIANLDLSPAFTAAVPVLPGAVGPFNGPFPASLVRPDRGALAPRVGIAWKPFQRTVVRAGYGINYNTGAYSNIALQLAFQPPFSITQTNIASPSSPLGFAFSNTPPTTVTNSYAVDPNYRMGYVQIWNLNVQREIRPTLVLNLDYTGTKGTRLDIVEAPNRTATGLRIPGVQPFLWETSQGDSIAHAGSVRLRKRLQRGISIGGTYTYSKSIDNASTIGSGATVVAQNAFDLAAERGLSSFDQRHKFTADYLWELPFGKGRALLTDKSVLRDVFGDWQWSGDWTIGSGLPFTPRVLGSFTDVNRGTNGTLRADVTGAPVGLSNPGVAEWFNTAAFVAPPQGQFGDARRNSITGPGSVVFNMALTKVIPISDTRMLELRAQAANIFNTPQFTAIDTIVNSPSFGRVIAVGNMRTLTMTARFRF